MTYVTCRLTAKNRDQLRNPTLGNRVWATFFTKKTSCILACVCGWWIARDGYCGRRRGRMSWADAGVSSACSLWQLARVVSLHLQGRLLRRRHTLPRYYSLIKKYTTHCHSALAYLDIPCLYIILASLLSIEYWVFIKKHVANDYSDIIFISTVFTDCPYRCASPSLSGKSGPKDQVALHYY